MTSQILGYLPFLVSVSIVTMVMGLTKKECAVNVCNYTHPGLQCPRDHIVLVTNVTCSGLSTTRCPRELFLDVLNECSGKEICSLRLLALKDLQDICRKGPRVSLRYTCIKRPMGEDHYEACTGPSRLTASRGFVFSPGYPARYSKEPCWWKLFLNRSQDVEFTIYEMQSFFDGQLNDTPDFLRISPAGAAPSCPFKHKDVVSLSEFRGDVLTVTRFRVRCHMEAEIMLRQLSGAGKGVRLLLFYQVVPTGQERPIQLPAYLTRSCETTASEAMQPRLQESLPDVTYSETPLTTTYPVTPSVGTNDDVDIARNHENYIGLLAGLVIGGLGSVCLIICLAVLCLKRKKKKPNCDYNSFSDGKSVSSSGYATGTTTSQGNGASSTKVFSETSVGCETESQYDVPNNPTYESIDKYILDDTYCRVADEIPYPPPAPKSLDDHETFDTASATYAEIPSILDERIPPEVPISYREHLRQQLKGSQKTNTENIYSDSSKFIHGNVRKLPKVPPTLDGHFVPVKNYKSRDTNDSKPVMDKYGRKLNEPIYAYPTNDISEEDDGVIFVENDLYEPFTAT